MAQCYVIFGYNFFYLILVPTQILIGPFRQLLPMTNLPLKGPLTDNQLQVLEEAAIVLDGDKIAAIGPYTLLRNKYPTVSLLEIKEDMVLLPGLIDCHTHICFGGSRARDYALRIAGTSYQEILKQGGGIHDSVAKTRAASLEELARATAKRANRHLQEGVTTLEVKSGYGLSVEEELKMLRAVRMAAEQTAATLIPTCLAAHVKPKEAETADAWLKEVLLYLLPVVKQEALAERVDIFIEDEAFPARLSKGYLEAAKTAGFSITVHADQFSAQGVPVAVQVGAHSADHLESSTEANLLQLAASDTVAVALPGASMGLGMDFTPARTLLDAGACLAIATDWNPGSAPMGDLLLQAAVMGAAQKLSTAETLAAITSRAAHALRLQDRGQLATGLQADMIAFDAADYREILYHQGKLKPAMVWKGGQKC
ncbi:imidazolonepropionase [Cesiribacter sp. SM1]|uniref:imidazolonepropionase n=1 Tax=Cesiribacter sp. SM1 TaxID=2861196 RepID=UPI001CD75D17|nr:imidazolonepropionase [Cesiribacter sp. SM1]